ncbi:MAG: hypothetical protein IJ660_05225 [Alphaproteobacteria bacterium]|nr:hypothetical protein [Alphaproteobacteria bacterium]
MADYWGKANQRKTNAKQVLSIREKLIRSLLLAVLLTLLVTFDFVLYMHSGSVFLAEGGINLPVLINIVYIFAVCLVLMLLTFLFPPLQFILFSGICAILTIGFMTQFLQIDRSQYLVAVFSSVLDPSLLYMIDGISHWIVAGVVFVIAYYLLSVSTYKSLITFSGVIFFIILCFFGVDLISGKAPEQISEIYHSTENNFAPQKKKMIFLFMPHAAPYSVISAESRNKMDKRELLQQVELGFLVKNGFKVYSNAYVTGESDETNMVEMLNVLDNKVYKEHILRDVALTSLWKFKSAQRPNIFLKDNQLYDIFQKAQYKVNTTQTQQIELCKKNGQYVSDRCLSRISLPMDITTRGFPVEDRTTILMYQWLNSFELISNQYVVSALQSVLNKTEMKRLAYPYERLYVVNSFQVLQKLLDTIAEDRDAGVYFVYLNFPDDLLVYDEWCKLKPYVRWNTLNPRFKTSMMYANSTDYNEQMLCLWGQMSDFMQNLVSSGQADNLTLVLHGVSGIERMQNTAKSFVDQFKNQNLVFMAIRDPEAQFSVNRRVCHSRDLLRQHLFGQLCQEYNTMQYSQTAKETLLAELKDSGIKKYMIPRALSGYEKWLENWQMNRQPPFLKASFTTKKTQAKEDNKVLQMDTATQILSEGLGKVTENSISYQENTNVSPQEVKEESVEDVDDSAYSLVKDDIVPLIHSESETIPSQPVDIEKKMLPKAEDVVPVSVPEVKSELQKEVSSKEISKVGVKETPKPNVVQPEVKKVTSPKKEVKEAKPVEKKTQVITTPATKIIVKHKSTKPHRALKVTVSPAYEYADTAEAAPNLNKALLENASSSVQEKKSSDNQPVLHAEKHSVSGDFLLEPAENNWEFDPAKALNVSGDEASQPTIVVKEQ